MPFRMRTLIQYRIQYGCTLDSREHQSVRFSAFFFFFSIIKFLFLRS